LDVKSLDVNWGPLKMKLDGSVALDEANRPVGALTAHFTDYHKLIDSVTGSAETGEGQGFKALLDGLVKASGQPQNTLSLPFSMQEGTLYLGPIPVTSLPPIIGPEAPAAPPPATK
jgi:hypothetical protein